MIDGSWNNLLYVKHVMNHYVMSRWTSMRVKYQNNSASSGVHGKTTPALCVDDY